MQVNMHNAVLSAPVHIATINVPCFQVNGDPNLGKPWFHGVIGRQEAVDILMGSKLHYVLYMYFVSLSLSADILHVWQAIFCIFVVISSVT